MFGLLFIIWTLITSNRLQNFGNKPDFTYHIFSTHLALPGAPGVHVFWFVLLGAPGRARCWERYDRLY